MHLPADEPIKRLSDYQRDWPSLIPALPKGKFAIQSTETLSIHGDAPKCFISMRDCLPGQYLSRRPSRWPRFIAKVGSKHYPTESITEHLITRIGQTCGVNIADSQLRLVGRQVRFLSRYFLRSGRSLVHGIEIFREHLDQEMVEQIATERREQEFYTFQTVEAAVGESFPGHERLITGGFVEMLAFDALVGNNDRHPANWGVIVSLEKRIPPRFSPVFDSARGLFWNLDEARLAQIEQDPQMLEAYCRRSCPKIGWDGQDSVDHFQLVSLVARHYPDYHAQLRKLTRPALVDSCARIIDSEFSLLMSERRRRLIERCLRVRHTLYCTAVDQGSSEGRAVP
jgi:hypothetical protein